MSEATRADPVGGDTAFRVTVGPLTVEFRLEGSGGAGRWRDLLAGFPDATAGPRSDMVVTVSYDGDTGYRTAVDDRELLVGRNLAAHEVAVTRLLNERKLEREPHLLHLHGAAVERESLAVLLIAASGSGKSTLTARLVERGWRYVTDEQVTIDPATLDVYPYPRPITLRGDVWDLFPAIAGTRARAAEGERRLEAPPAAFGATVRGDVRVAHIVVPRFDPREPTAIVPIGRCARVVERLVSCCHDLERLCTSGFDALVRLTTQVHSWEMPFDDVDRAADLVDRLELHTIPSPIVVRDLGPPRAGSSVAASAQSRRFADGSVVVFLPASMRLVCLDDGGTELWTMLLGGQGPDDIIAMASDATSAANLGSWMNALYSAGAMVPRGARCDE